ncbi:acyl-CoA thioesterase [Thetidibacter halocola]|uniref:Acyl-CoA thioesterase n=1 Tax=Thetidibacter halocola TaxID=2827239 RepID=A0A8J7WI17_9RHOB|nr:thioesterase family protein [Thetidibacter halocola]MBS0126006.1 acyl-CoA thioesterase [Thetidibacter halocola]
MSGDGFVHEIRVTWGDCDPAKIVYTARIPWFALDAINAWWEHHLGEGWYQLELDRGLGTPFVNMTLDFRAPITPRHRLLCAVRPVRLGETSISFEVLGRQDRVLCFEGRFTCVFVVAQDFRKCAPPDDIRDIVVPLLP